jgi:translation initiation factor IF-3
LSRPFPPRSSGSGSFVRINGKIRAREVRVIGVDGRQLGVLSLGEAINMARAHGVDLVEVAATATPPVCRIVDYGKYRYELAKKEKESRKHQHANKVKEVQLSANIDPHDFETKLGHAVDFLCEDMKVKVNLRFRGREMAHTEIGFQVVNKFLADVAPWGHPDAVAKLAGRNINVMISPLPRNKRAKNPRETGEEIKVTPLSVLPAPETQPDLAPKPTPVKKPAAPPSGAHPATPASGFTNNPFANLRVD